MRRFHRAITWIVTALIITACCTACGVSTTGGGNTTDSVSTTGGSTNDSVSTTGGSITDSVSTTGGEETGSSDAHGSAGITIEDIAWNVDTGIVDGERFALLDYTNKSPFILVGFTLQFQEKADITEEERETFFADVRTILRLDENDAEDMEDFAELKTVPIAMHAESEMVTKPGESASAIIGYYNGYYDVRDIRHCSLVAPDIATIRYIEDGTVKTVYYDFASQKHTADSKTEPAYAWTDKGLENVIPKPDADYVTGSVLYSSEHFSFDVHGWSLEQFNRYVSACKEEGFTVDPREHEGFYSADSANGYSVYLYYDDDDCSMSASVRQLTESADEDD